MIETFEPFDLLHFTFPSDPRLSPDGRKVAFVEHRVDPENDGYKSAVLLLDVASGPGPDSYVPGFPEKSAEVEFSAPRRFTSGYHRDTHPRWSPDGAHLAFLSDRRVEGSEIGKQVWYAPTDGGEPRPLTRIEGGVEGFAWSPLGDGLTVTVRCDPERGVLEVEEAEEDAEEDRLRRLYNKYTEDVRHIDRLLYKHDGIGFLKGKRSHVATIAFDPDHEGFAEPVDLTFGDFDHADPAFSPDGKWIAVAACREPDPDPKRFRDLWLFPTGSGDPIKVTASVGDVSCPAFSPDGRSVAYLGFERTRPGWYDHHRMWIVEVGDDPGAMEEFEPREVTGDHDVAFGNTAIGDMGFSGPDMQITWDVTGSHLFHYTSERGTTQLVRVDIADGRVDLLTSGDRAIFNAHLRPELSLGVIALSTPRNPGQVHLLSLEDREPAGAAGEFSDRVPDAREQKIGEAVAYLSSGDILGSRHVAVAERFTFRADGDSPLVDGWIMMPPDASQRESLPVILQIHGGPAAMYTGGFFFEFQLLAAAGYAVVFCNPRGSSGYGEEFRTAIQPGWGDVDYADVMAALDVALKENPKLDEDRCGVAGGSYGGYMTNWIIGHTDRFRAAITMRCVSNIYSFWGTCDLGPLWSDMYDGRPWENPEKYHQQSPVRYMDGVSTPTLVIHSEEDNRCPVEQGEQVYTTLKSQGVETEMIRYPGESHGLSRGGHPWHRIHRLERILEWFERYVPDPAR
ncbi:MAG: prolyl oligopeptidase family serine peptidase [Bacillota bacterium]